MLISNSIVASRYLQAMNLTVVLATVLTIEYHWSVLGLTGALGVHETL